MGIYDRDHRKNDPCKKTPEGIKQYKLSDFENINPQNEKKIDSNKQKMTDEEKKKYYEQINEIRNKNDLFKQDLNDFKQKKKKLENKNNEKRSIATEIILICILILGFTLIKKTLASESSNEIKPKINQNQKVIYRAPTPKEEQTYMQEHHLIKMGNEYHWCGIKESKDILPITKALDMDCQNDFCRIQKYYDYVKRIPYEQGTIGKDKNAIEVMKEWKGDCDERSNLLASMMLANGYKTILLYTKDHALTALNIPNYESNNNRAYVQYKGIKYYIAETTDPNGQIGAYNNDVMHSLKFVYDVNEKRVARGDEIAIQLFK